MASGRLTRYVIPAAIAAAYAPMLCLHMRSLWRDGRYWYFPLLLIVIAVLLWLRFLGQPTAGRRPLAPRITRLIPGLVTLAAAVFLWSPWLAALSFILVAHELLRSLVGETDRSVTPIWALLLPLLPPPFHWDTRLTYWIHDIASQISSSLLDFLSINHLLSSRVTHLPGRSFPVMEVCGGTLSLFAFIATALVVAVVLRRRLMHSLLLVVVGGWWAIVINALCLTGVVLVYGRDGFDLTAGPERVAATAAAMVAGAGMLISTDFLLVFLLPSGDGLQHDEIAEESEDLPAPAAEPEVAAGRAAAAATAISLCFLALGVVQVVSLVVASERRLTAGDTSWLVASLAVDSLPDRLLERERVSFRMQKGGSRSHDAAHSAVWTYRGEGGQTTVALDFPLIGWYYLTGVYEDQGWEVVSREVRPDPGRGAPARATLVRAALQDPQADRGLLVVSQFRANGSLIEPPGTPGLSLSSWASALRNRITRRLADFGFGQVTYQVQMLSIHSPPQQKMQPSQADSLQAFLEVRERLRQHVQQSASGNHE
jgi:exosortase